MNPWHRIRNALARRRMERDLADIGDVLHAATLLRQYSRETLDLVSGYGEVWSSRLLHAHLVSIGASSARIDAREVLVAEWRDERLEIDWAASRARLDAWMASHADLPATLIITGFVAATHEGVVTTLGRNGSDFSASIFAALLDASEVHIWTDVDGVMGFLDMGHEWIVQTFDSITTAEMHDVWGKD